MANHSIQLSNPANATAYNLRPKGQQPPASQDNLSSSMNKLKLQTEVPNDIDSELDTPVDQVLRKLNLEANSSDNAYTPKTPIHSQLPSPKPSPQQPSRMRSSTVSAALYHNNLPQNTSNSRLFSHAGSISSRENVNVAEPHSSSSKLTSSGSQYSNNASLNKDPRALRHTETVNYGATHLKHQREQVIKLAGGRITVYEYGRSHEHDYSKYKTHPNKPMMGIFNWMKKKESSKTEREDSYEIIEKSVSLLPDKYSGDLMRVKNNPKNYIWNYDDDEDEEDEYVEGDDEDSDYDSDNAEPNFKTKGKVGANRKSSLQSMTSSKSSNYARSLGRQSKRLTRHYNSDDEYEDEDDYVKDMEARNDEDVLSPTVSPSATKPSGVPIKDEDKGENKNKADDSEETEDDDDEEDDDDDDFDDEVDNMMIEPIIGKEQVFLINSMLNKIEHPEKFKSRLEEKEREGKIKLMLSQKYGHIEGVVGKGSYGTVCISSKTVGTTKIYFAIKQLKRKQGESLHHFGNRVTSEFMISSSLTHQAVINVYDLMVDPVSMTYSEIMEFIPCGDLFSLISTTNGLHIVECDCFFKQILNAITYLHSVGVSHNDLKVENLLLTRKGQLKIIDFGTSAVFRTAWESDVQLSRGACGSERYVAPEQYNKEREYDPRLGDVWSLGIIYLTMYYGKYAWEAAKMSDETYARFIDTRAVFDYSYKSPTKAHQFLCVKPGGYSPIEGIKGGILNSWVQKGGELDSNIRSNDEEYVNDSRKYVLYNILNPDPTFRMRTYQIWQSEWIKNFHVCDAGRGYVSYDNYIEMALRSAQDVEAREREYESDREKEKDKGKVERKESRKGHGFLGFGSKI